MHQFRQSDLEVMARAWVDKNIGCSPGSEQFQIWVERMVKELERVFNQAGEPIERDLARRAMANLPAQWMKEAAEEIFRKEETEQLSCGSLAAIIARHAPQWTKCLRSTVDAAKRGEQVRELVDAAREVGEL